MARDALRVTHKLRLDLDTPYYAALKKSWGENLERIFREHLPKFEWEADPATLRPATPAERLAAQVRAANRRTKRRV